MTERLYDNDLIASRAIPDAAELTARLAPASEATRREGRWYDDIAWGEGDAAVYDLTLPPYRTPRPMPILVFIHGGFWRAFSRKDFAFAAHPAMRASAGAALIEYPLFPGTSFEEILDHGVGAIRHLRETAHQNWLDPDRIVLVGHSAGAHLALCTAWALEPEERAAITGIYALSGVFDLLEVRESAIDEYLRLDDDVIRRWSPLRNALDPLPGPV